MEYIAGKYDIIVVGAGHAGCEAALAAARLGCNTAVFAINLESIANMPCNPSIGGTAKGHLVREVDALGGEMGKIADETLIQSKMLNMSKGPAVHSLRAQIDKKQYQIKMKYILESQENLDVRQGEVVELLYEKNKITGIKTHTDAIYKSKIVILTTGTFLKGKVIIGDISYNSGPDGIFPANKLSDSLESMGIELFRFKTGTPARLNKRSIDFSKMEKQYGDEKILPFSFKNEKIEIDQILCWLTYTNEKTHEIINNNLHRSPLYGNKTIEGVGPRYCPSIEDKVVRFADKKKHQIFLEPMGLETQEMYLQGVSSSLPEEVQIEMMRSIKGLEEVKVMRNAYAIEYDCINPLQLGQSLEFKNIEGLFSAGQINGSSGYEEAAGQGIIAGINAVMKFKNKDPIILNRSQAYIGVLIDDLVTKGTNEPYRMLTSRAEYRLILRQDNADQRLIHIGYNLGLISEEIYNKFLLKMRNIGNEIKRLESIILPPSEKLNKFLESKNTSRIKTGIRVSDLLKRPQILYEDIEFLCSENSLLRDIEKEQVMIMIKYEGYIKRQLQQVEQFKKMENKKLNNIDYSKIKGLRLEAIEKLKKINPYSVGQASRISGVSQADITVLLIYLEQNKGYNKK
ncbi:MAG: tRNA uridine-5-carboxymethylaminomethyl(34) synthesis enzyme MnmG [Clostridiales bacterium]